MTKFVCKNCGFRVESGKKAETCPYCDKRGLERERDAAELLNSVDEE